MLSAFERFVFPALVFLGGKVVSLIPLSRILVIVSFLCACLVPLRGASAQTVAPTCPPGYTLSGNNCVKGAPAPSCPAGYTFSGGQCKAVVQPSPSGPSTGPWVLIIRKALGVSSARELDGATICTVAGTPSVSAITSYFQNNRMAYEPLAASSGSDARDKYIKGACDVLIADDRSSAPALRSLTPAGAHIILPERLVAVGAAPTARPTRPAPATPVQPVNLALDLQRELKRIGCYTGGIDGDWGPGSQSALRRFSSQAGLRLGNQPSQNALNEALRTDPGYCQPVRKVPKRKKRKKKALNPDTCYPADWAFCKPRAIEGCEGEETPSCINRETRFCLREEIGCKP